MDNLIDRIRSVLAEHKGHRVRIDGPMSQAETTVRTGDDPGWKYGGFTVHCLTCEAPLSPQWN